MLSVSTNTTTTNPPNITASALTASPTNIDPPSASPAPAPSPSPVSTPVRRAPIPAPVAVKSGVAKAATTLQPSLPPPRAPSPVSPSRSISTASAKESVLAPESRPNRLPSPSPSHSPSPSPSPSPAQPPVAQNTPSSPAPPSAHRPANVSAARRLSRRLSAEFGTYDIAAARKEREALSERRQSVVLNASPVQAKEKEREKEKSDEDDNDFEPIKTDSEQEDTLKGRNKGKEREIGERPAEDAAKAASRPIPPLASQLPQRQPSRPLPAPPTQNGRSMSPTATAFEEHNQRRNFPSQGHQQPRQEEQPRVAEAPAYTRSRVESNASVRRLPIPPSRSTSDEATPPVSLRSRKESNRGALPPTPADIPRSRNISGETITPGPPAPPPTSKIPPTPSPDRGTISQSSSVSSSFSTTTQSTSMSVHEMQQPQPIKIRKKRNLLNSDGADGEPRQRAESMTRENGSSRGEPLAPKHQRPQPERAPTIVTTTPEPEPEPEPVEEETEPAFYPLRDHLLIPDLLAPLLRFLSFRETLPLLSISMDVKRAMEDTKEVKETVLERYLAESIGYRRWSVERMGKRKEPLSLTLRDLNSYMRGISFPPHHYFDTADTFLAALADSTTSNPNVARRPVPKHLTNQVRMMASSCRAYTKVVIRLRAQADAEAAHLPPVEDDRGRNTPRGKNRMPATGPGTHPPTTGPYGGLSRRSPSPAFSFTSYNRHGPSSTPVLPSSGPTVSTTPGKFRSPLYRSGNAPLLRVFVPSPEGAWLSDSSVLECERELKRAGVLGLLKVGDVVHDLAAGDEGNTGRLIWDGNYLIDLDYSYSHLGEIPHYVDSLAFPPSYFHKIVRTSGNPIVYMDLAPFAQEIANHLQLIQDRIQTETPQGGHHTVVRYVHRSRFRIKAGTPVNINSPPVVGPDGTSIIRMIDSGWHGTIVIEAEGTNEGLADLQTRVGNSVMLFPVKNVMGAHGRRPSGDQWDPRSAGQPGEKSVFRLLRGQSRPGEIWLRCVREKEKIM